MPVSQEHVLNVLRAVNDPDLKRDIVSLGFVKHLTIDGGRVAFQIELTTPACPVRDLMREEARQAVAAIPGVTSVEIGMTSQVRPSVSLQAAGSLTPTIKNIVAVASGKGGVGKSTVSANLALAIARTGARVGLMDADVYGPSIPTILGITSQPAVDERNRITPVVQQGLKVISMGFFMKPEEAVVWRGPMLHKTVQQFLGGVEWGELDYFIADLPPGCLAGDTLVATIRGPVSISEVSVGSEVYSFAGHINRPPGRAPRDFHAALVPRKVLAVIPQGQAEVYELKTDTRTIRGTVDHPILTLKRTRTGPSRFQNYGLAWEPLGNLKPPDIILVAKKLPQSGKPFLLPRLEAKGRHPFCVGTASSDDLLRLIGYFLGDGTVRRANGRYWGVWFSEPTNGKYRDQYIQLLKSTFQLKHVHEQPHKFAALSVQAAELFDKLGLEKSVHAKSLPEWVFALPESQKLALIEGYCDADGHRRVARAGYRRAGWMCFESPNRNLVAQVRALCMDVGLKVGNLTSRTRQIRLPSTGRYANSTCYGFEANRTAKTDTYGAKLIRGSHTGQGLRHEYVGFESIRSVQPIGVEEVYDLQVEDQHNFVANGLIVHNTGDVQLSLCQSIPLTGAVIVSTPQDVALNVAQKAIAMFKKLNTPILGVIENMSHYVCPHCGKRDEIFGSGGARKIAERLGIPFLGEIPLATRIRETSDAGRPIVLAEPDSPSAKAFIAAAEQLAAQLSIRAMQGELAAQPKMTF